MLIAYFLLLLSKGLGVLTVWLKCLGVVTFWVDSDWKLWLLILGYYIFSPDLKIFSFIIYLNMFLSLLTMSSLSQALVTQIFALLMLSHESPSHSSFLFFPPLIFK
jgi:hypothetical protein